jgi:phosphoenolpyruvate carboxykinase (GTP)
MAMLPYCSYNLADYLGHWLRLGSLLRRPPRIFHVNWFRTGERGQLLWPGFGENIRVLAWVLERVEQAVDAIRTPIGFVPRSLDTRGLELAADALEQLLRVDVGGWLREARESEAFLELFGERLPATLRRQNAALLGRLRDATN